MTINSKNTLSALAAVALLSLSVSAYARDHHRHHGGIGSVASHLTSSLTPIGSNLGGGIISYKSDTTTGNTTLHASLSLPIDGAVIANIDAAAANIYILTDTTTGTTCNLTIKEIDFVPTEVATFAVQDSVNGTTFSDVVCAGSSALAAGDAISLALSTDPGTPLFSGTLAQPAFMGH